MFSRGQAARERLVLEHLMERTSVSDDFQSTSVNSNHLALKAS
jgi:hypothetical protein